MSMSNSLDELVRQGISVRGCIQSKHLMYKCGEVAGVWIWVIFSVQVFDPQTVRNRVPFRWFSVQQSEQSLLGLTCDGLWLRFLVD